MKRRDSADFAELLAEAGIAAVEGCGMKKKSSSTNLEPMPVRTEDALSLSVQGKKAMVPGREVKVEISSAEAESLNTDLQGNRVRLSASARGMALDMEDKVAWETRLERRKKGG